MRGVHAFHFHFDDLCALNPFAIYEREDIFVAIYSLCFHDRDFDACFGEVCEIAVAVAIALARILHDLFIGAHSLSLRMLVRF